jgi:hypothetical protein
MRKGKEPTVVETIAGLLNWVNDWDLTWVGFRALRPAPDQDMTPKIVGRLCFVYCPLSAMLAFVLTFTTNRLFLQDRAPAYLPWVMAAIMAFVCLILQSLMAWAWNRRAAALREVKPKSVQ